MRYGLRFVTGSDIIGGEFVRVQQTPSGLVVENLLGVLAIRVADPESSSDASHRIILPNSFQVEMVSRPSDYVINPHDIETAPEDFVPSAVTALQAVIGAKRVLQAHGNLESVDVPMEQVRDSGLVVVSSEPLTKEALSPGAFKAFVANPDEIELFSRLTAHVGMLAETPPDAPGHYV